MTKGEIVTNVAVRTGMDEKAADRVISAFLQELREGMVTNKRIQLPGFGTFGTKRREARKCRNPQTGEEMEAPACTIPAFKAGSRLKAAVSDGMEKA